MFFINFHHLFSLLTIHIYLIQERLKPDHTLWHIHICSLKAQFPPQTDLLLDPTSEGRHHREDAMLYPKSSRRKHKFSLKLAVTLINPTPWSPWHAIWNPPWHPQLEAETQAGRPGGWTPAIGVGKIHLARNRFSELHRVQVPFK